MPNEVKIIFVGDAAQLFSTADQVEARMVNLGKGGLASIANPFSALQSSIQSGTQQVSSFVNQTVSGSAKAQEGLKKVATEAKNLTAATKELSEGLRQNDPFQSGIQMSLSDASQRQRQFIERENNNSQLATQARLDAERRQFQQNYNFRRNQAPPVGEAAGAEQEAAGAASGAAAGASSFGLGVGATAAIVAAGAAAYAGVKVFKESLSAYAESEQRAKSLRSETEGLGHAFQNVSGNARDFANATGQSLGNVQTTLVNVSKLIEDLPSNFKSVATAAEDLGAARGLDQQALAKSIELASKGQASVELFGRNASAVFDIYASSLGRTADSLTDTEKRQALVNETLRQGAYHAGEAAKNLDTLSGAEQKFSNTVEKFLSKIGEIATPGVVKAIDFVNGVTGGDVETDTQKTQREAGDRQKFFDQYKADYAQLQHLVQASNSDAYSNLSTFSVKFFGDQSKLLAGGEGGQQALREATERGKTFAENFKKGAEDALKHGDIQYQKDTLQSLFQLRNIFPYDEYRDLSARLRKSIEDDYQKANEKIGEMRKSASEAFNEIPHFTDNPFVDLYSKGEKALISFDEKTRGVTDTLRKQGEELIRQNTALDAFKTRIDTSLSAFDLRATADRFRQPTAREQAFYLNQTVSRYRRESNSTNPDVARYFQNEAYRVANYDQEQQKKSVNDKLDLLFNTRVKNDDEKAIRDARIAAFAQNLDPDLISNVGRRKELTQVFDSQAVRLERREIDALSLQKEQRDYQKQIAEYSKGLLDIANKGGFGAANAAAGGRLNIRVSDDTSEKRVANATVANESDVGRTYNLGFFQGTNE